MGKISYTVQDCHILIRHITNREGGSTHGSRLKTYINYLKNTWPKYENLCKVIGKWKKTTWWWQSVRLTSEESVDHQPESDKHACRVSLYPNNVNKLEGIKIFNEKETRTYKKNDSSYFKNRNGLVRVESYY